MNACPYLIFNFTLNISGAIWGISLCSIRVASEPDSLLFQLLENKSLAGSHPYQNKSTNQVNSNN